MVSDTIRFVLQDFVTLLVVVTSLAILALFVSMTSPYMVKKRLRTARMGCLVALGLWSFFRFSEEKHLNFLELPWARSM
jgi:small neutral amino acid transporter SnatA (MarC family)